MEGGGQGGGGAQGTLESVVCVWVDILARIALHLPASLETHCNLYSHRAKKTKEVEKRKLLEKLEIGFEGEAGEGCCGVAGGMTIHDGRTLTAGLTHAQSINPNAGYLSWDADWTFCPPPHMWDFTNIDKKYYKSQASLTGAHGARKLYPSLESVQEILVRVKASLLAETGLDVAAAGAAGWSKERYHEIAKKKPPLPQMGFDATWAATLGGPRSHLAPTNAAAPAAAAREGARGAGGSAAKRPRRN